MRFPHARILIFAKAPVPGRCKTRLIPALGAKGASALAERMLQDTIARVASARLASIELRCDPDCSHPVFVRIAERFPIALEPQHGAGLGERMLAAASAALGQANVVVLIGCDCPGLTAAHLAEALAALADHDAVLGPAADGGYVLLGLTRARRDGLAPLFEEMPWGSDRVAAATRMRMRALGWDWYELETLADIDRPEDLHLTVRD